MVAVKSSQPRKVRKFQALAPLHRARKMISAHLAEDLMLKYNLRSLPVRKGDTVKVMRGVFKGHTGKVASVDTKARKITVEGVTIAKSDKSQVPRAIDASNVLITKLELSDAWRAKKLEKRKELVKIERKRKKREKEAKVEEKLAKTEIEKEEAELEEIVEEGKEAKESESEKEELEKNE
ncbi:MAG: 50S ribosomal protein L24 [Candidatus Thermoplasmatota archaeon]